MEIKLTLLLLLVAVMLQGGRSGDLPTNFNLAYGRRIEASSTCGVGVSEKELFCKLTGANPDRTDDSFSQVEWMCVWLFGWGCLFVLFVCLCWLFVCVGCLFVLVVCLCWLFVCVGCLFLLVVCLCWLFVCVVCLFVLVVCLCGFS